MNNFYKHTPVFWRKVGDSILIFGTTMTATLAGMEADKLWIISMSLITALGKMVTNFFKDETV